ncbi:MAG: hypothetical protein Rsou_0492 [Candidatus Ruthia sp. Asou_11_S2]|nr:hypothetical protein [Candidatus Ruthia sp. Asou_11_S2]
MSYIGFIAKLSIKQGAIKYHRFSIHFGKLLILPILMLGLMLKVNHRSVNKAYAQLTLIYIKQDNKEKAAYHHEQMLKWVHYFDGRYGFGPY